MAVGEGLRSRLTELLGEDQARELMERLPVGEPATKEDIERLERAARAGFERIDQRFERIDERFERIDERFVELEQRFDLKLDSMANRVTATIIGEMISQNRLYMLSVVGVMISFVALIIATRLV